MTTDAIASLRADVLTRFAQEPARLAGGDPVRFTELVAIVDATLHALNDLHALVTEEDPAVAELLRVSAMPITEADYRAIVTRHVDAMLTDLDEHRPAGIAVTVTGTIELNLDPGPRIVVRIPAASAAEEHATPESGNVRTLTVSWHPDAVEAAEERLTQALADPEGSAGRLYGTEQAIAVARDALRTVIGRDA